MIARFNRFSSTRIDPVRFALATLLIASLALRLFGLNWDDQHDLHPDESFITDWVLVGRVHLEWPPDMSQLLDPARSGLNPRSVDPSTGEYREFAYGALPLFVTDLVIEGLKQLTGQNFHNGDKAQLVGRTLSALFDTLTVLMVYLIGARVFTRSVGLVGGLIIGFAPMSIQLAHFFTTDSWLTFFVTLCLYASIRAAEAGAFRWFAVTGASFGLAMATKGSVFALVGILVVTIAYDLWRRTGTSRTVINAINPCLLRAAVSGLFAVASFAVFEPFAILNSEIYLQSLLTQSDIVRGIQDVPFTRIYIGTMPVLYQTDDLVRWGLGPISGLLAIAGIGCLLWRIHRNLSAGRIVLAAWILGYGVVIALPETKYLRYMAPLVPALAITAAFAFVLLLGFIVRLTRRPIAAIVALILLVAMSVPSAAFVSIYGQENTRLAASRWIFDNVPAGSRVTADYWDDELPKDLSAGLSSAQRQYETVRLDLYADRPPEQVADDIFHALSEADVVVQSSNRLPASIHRSPWRYPVQIRYYDLLNRNRLGFRLTAEFTQSPRLGPFTFDDRNADESLINYDHPTVLIFEKQSALSRAEFDALMAPAVAMPWSPTRHAPRKSLLLDQPVESLPVVSDARWSQRLTNNSFVALGVWIVLLIVLQIAFMPLVGVTFSPLLDRGWGFSRLVTLLLTGYVMWLLASWRVVAFRAVWCWSIVLLLAVVCWLAVIRHPRSPRVWFNWTRPQRVAEAVFWMVFLTFLLFRFVNPDSWHPFWGGEKPMEYAHLNATLRSATFPPYDPWFAGGYINYYYYGLYLVAFCVKLTGIPSEIAFNLAQPTIMGLLASGGFSVASTLGRDLTRSRPVVIPAGLIGAFLLVGAGNWSGLQQLMNANRAPFDEFNYWVWSGSRIVSHAITEFPFFTGLYADLHAHVIALPITVLSIALAYMLASDKATWSSALASRQARISRSTLVMRLGMVAIVLGTLAATNAWDVATFGTLFLASLVMGTTSMTNVSCRILILLACGVGTPLLGYLLFLPFFQHYVALFSSISEVRGPTPLGQVMAHFAGLVLIAWFGLAFLLIGRLGRETAVRLHPIVPVAVGLGLVAARRQVGTADAQAAAALGGAFVVVVAATLMLIAWSSLSTAAHLRASRWSQFGLAGFGVAIGYSVLIDRIALGFFLTLACIGWATWIRGPNSASQFIGLLALVGASVAAGTELVYVVDNLSATDAYRMNTVFKFYNQIWVLLAVAGGGLVAAMKEGARHRAEVPSAVFPSDARAAGRLKPLRRHAEYVPQPSNGAAIRQRWAQAGVIAAILVIASSLLYPIFAVGPRLAQRFSQHPPVGTLNALEWMDDARLTTSTGDSMSFAGDRAAIDWFNANVTGTPVIAEASIPPYRGNGSRISIATGLPTIIGWENHESQQRYPDDLPRRTADVRDLFNATDPLEKRDLIRMYSVQYIVVGDVERHWPNATGQPYASADGLETFNQMVGTDLEVAFQHEATTVYRVMNGDAP